jgi:hypothetical protein
MESLVLGVLSGLTGLVGKLAARGTIDGGAYRT